MCARVVVLLLLILSGCDPQQPTDYSCAAVAWEAVPFVVVNSERIGEPGVAIFVMQLRTRELFDFEQTNGDLGVYVMADDSFLPSLQASGDTLLVLGAKDSRRFTARFVVGISLCHHVYKMSGPDSVVLN
jgi:hypothetical protein